MVPYMAPSMVSDIFIYYDIFAFSLTTFLTKSCLVYQSLPSIRETAAVFLFVHYLCLVRPLQWMLISFFSKHVLYWRKNCFFYLQHQKKCKQKIYVQRHSLTDSWLFLQRLLWTVPFPVGIVLPENQVHLGTQCCFLVKQQRYWMLTMEIFERGDSSAVFLSWCYKPRSWRGGGCSCPLGR